MKRKIVLLIFLFFFSCGGEKEVKLYNILGVWEVTPTLDCQEYDCFGQDCLEADAPIKYSMTIEKSGNNIEAIFHYSGTVEGPYILEKKVDNTYYLYDFQDNDYFVEIHEMTIILNSDDVFVGKESWRYISSEYCNEASNLIGEKKI